MVAGGCSWRRWCSPSLAEVLRGRWCAAVVGSLLEVPKDLARAPRALRDARAHDRLGGAHLPRQARAGVCVRGHSSSLVDDRGHSPGGHCLVRGLAASLGGAAHLEDGELVHGEALAQVSEDLPASQLHIIRMQACARGSACAGQ